MEGNFLPLSPTNRCGGGVGRVIIIPPTLVYVCLLSEFKIPIEDNVQQIVNNIIFEVATSSILTNHGQTEWECVSKYRRHANPKTGPCLPTSASASAATTLAASLLLLGPLFLRPFIV